MLSQRLLHQVGISAKILSTEPILWSRGLFTSSIINAESIKLKQGEDYFDKNKRLNRPMSPHLTIYKPQLTSMLSITHRGTGVFMSTILSSFSIGMLMLPDSYPHNLEIIQNLHLGAFVIFSAKLALTFPLMFHICNGIRHLTWDAGRGFKLKVLYQSGYAVVGFAAVLSVILSSL